jgi:hypothetical protein
MQGARNYGVESLCTRGAGRDEAIASVQAHAALVEARFSGSRVPFHNRIGKNLLKNQLSKICQMYSLFSQFGSLFVARKYPVRGSRESGKKPERWCGFFRAKESRRDPDSRNSRFFPD